MRGPRSSTDTSHRPGGGASQRVDLGIALLSALTVLAVTRVVHPSVGSDAVCYLGIADHIAAGKGLGFWLENPLVTWPPLWPVVLAGGKLVTRLHTDVVAVLFDAVGAGATAWLSVRILRRLGVGRRNQLIGMVMIGLGPTVVVLAAAVQTETIFNVVVLGLLLCLLRHHDDGGLRWLAGAVVCTWMAFLSRYAGLYIVPIVGFWLLLPRGGAGGASLVERVRARLAPALTYAVGALVVPLAWIARNLHVSNTAFGPRYPSNAGVVRNTTESMAGYTKYLVAARELPTKPAAFVALLAAAAFAVLCVGVVGLARGRAPVARFFAAAASGPGLLVVFGGGFTVSLIFSRSRYAIDNLDIRLLAPSLVALTLAGLVILERSGLLDRAATGLAVGTGAGRPRLARAALVVVVGWTAYQVLVTVAIIGPINHQVGGSGMDSAKAHAAAYSSALTAVPSGCELYANNPFDLYKSGTEAQQSPRKFQWQSPERTHELEQLEAKVARGDSVCLAWVGYTSDDSLWSESELRARFTFTRLASGGDVTTYRLGPLART